MEEALELARAKDAKERMAGVERLHEVLEASRRSLSSAEVASLVECCLDLLKDSSFKVSQGALQALDSAAVRAGDHFKLHFNALVPAVVERLGDAKQPVRDAARRLLLTLMEVSSPTIIVERAGSFAWTCKSWRIREEFARTVTSAIGLFSATELPLQRAILPPILQLLNDLNAAVREAAILCIEEMYAQAGSQFRDELQRHNLPSSLVKAINARLEGIQPKVQSSDGISSGYTAGEIKPVGVNPKKSSPKAKSSSRESSLFGGEGDVTEKVIDPIKVYSEKELLREIDKIAATLVPEKDWSIRIAAMQRIEGLVLGGATDYPCFFGLLKQLVGPLSTQLSDRRSSIVKQVCHLLCFLSKDLLGDFEACAELFIPVLLKLVVITVLVIAESADNCIKTMLRNCKVARVLPRIADCAKNDRNAVLRARCCDYALLILEHWPDAAEIQRSADLYEDMIRCCVSDAMSEVRSTARMCYRMFAKTWPERSRRLFSSFDPAIQRLINEEDGGMHRRHASPSVRDRGALVSMASQASAPSSLTGYGTSAIVAMDRSSSLSSGTSIASGVLSQAKSLGKGTERSLESVLHASKQKVTAIESMLRGLDLSDKHGSSVLRSSSLDLGVDPPSSRDPPFPAAVSASNHLTNTLMTESTASGANKGSNRNGGLGLSDIITQIQASKDSGRLSYSTNVGIEPLSAYSSYSSKRASDKLQERSSVDENSDIRDTRRYMNPNIDRQYMDTHYRDANFRDSQNSYVPNFQRPLLRKNVAGRVSAGSRRSLDDSQLSLGEMSIYADGPASLHEALSEGLSSGSDWSARVAAFNYLHSLLQQGQKGIQEVVQNFEKVMKLFFQHLDDPHHKVAQAALSTLADIILACRKPFEGYMERMLPHVFSRLIDPKELVRQACSMNLEVVSKTYSIDSLLPALLRALDEEKSSKVVEFEPENSTLRIYKLNLSGTCRVTCSLGMNFTVKSLDMTGVRLKSRCAKEFRLVLEQNQSLKEVNLSRTCLKDKGIVYIAAGLFKNRTLQTLHLNGNWFSGMGVEHLLCPLSRFSALQRQANITLTCITFGGERTRIGRDGLAAVIQFLITNETVRQLRIHDDESLRSDDFVKIFRSLEKNASLKCLSLQGCKRVEGEILLKTIMETLQINPWIEDIDLSRTPLQNSGRTQRIYQRLGQNEKTEPDMDSVKDMPLTEPKSCRVFFCGQECAGKTALCHSISQNFSASALPYLDQVRTIVNPVELAVKSVGMKIKTFKDEDTTISIWNLAGHHEFISLHDLMFPGHGSASFFIIISSLFRKPSNKEPKSSTEIEDDLQYWLRFIVSNSKRAIQQCMLPSVAIVLTHSDKINQPSQNLQSTVESIQRLRDKFQGFVDFYPTVFTVDARSSASVSKLTHHIRTTSKTILQRVPRVYQLCNDLIQILSDWRSENYNKPAMKWKEFGELCQLKVPPLRIRSRHDNKEKVEMKRRAIATCLHHIGEVIYFDELDFLILDFEWFCGEVLGQLIKLNVRKQHSSENNGFISRKELEKILRGSLQSPIPGMGSKVFENLDASDLVRMMLKLELCYEEDPSDPNSLLLIPSILEEGRGKPQRWQLSMPDCVYAGRHLECDDSSHMFLTPGFFPRLQVHLHNRIKAVKDQHGATYSLEKYLISISINGIYIRVELGGQLGYYIDVLACSTKNLTETLRVIHQIVIPAIQSVCHGITLTENVLRPECVRKLTPPRYRKTQFASLQQLKEALLSLPAESMYDYQHTWSPVLDSGRPILQDGFDFARDLLSDDDFREVLHRRYNDLYSLAQELQVPPENNPEGQGQSITLRDEAARVEPTFGGIAKGVEEVLQRLKIIEQEIRDLKQEIQGLRYYEHRLLLELHRKVNHLATFNVQVEERKVPNMIYFVRTENYTRRLVTTMLSGMNALRLHMLCEFRGQMHVVEDQMGCEIMQVDNAAVKSLAPYMKKFMTLVTLALKIGAHLAAGMGQMIPDLSKEVAHLAGSSVLCGAAGASAAGVLGAAAMGRRNRSMEGSRDIQQDLRAAQQWVVDFLRERNCSSGKDIAEKFGLWRVRYRDNGQIAWICRRHIYARSAEINEVPI